ncbi:hypothetical protein IWW50_007109, partial [Coemansia erecta]
MVPPYKPNEPVVERPMQPQRLVRFDVPDSDSDEVDMDQVVYVSSDDQNMDQVVYGSSEDQDMDPSVSSNTPDDHSDAFMFDIVHAPLIEMTSDSDGAMSVQNNVESPERTVEPRRTAD